MQSQTLIGEPPLNRFVEQDIKASYTTIAVVTFPRIENKLHGLFGLAIGNATNCTCVDDPIDTRRASRVSLDESPKHSRHGQLISLRFRLQICVETVPANGKEKRGGK